MCSPVPFSNTSSLIIICRQFQRFYSLTLTWRILQQLLVDTLLYIKVTFPQCPRVKVGEKLNKIIWHRLYIKNILEDGYDNWLNEKTPGGRQGYWVVNRKWTGQELHCRLGQHWADKCWIRRMFRYTKYIIMFTVVEWIRPNVLKI